jgi:hypothetical protein
MNSHSDYTRPGVEPWWVASPHPAAHPAHDVGAATRA